MKIGIFGGTFDPPHIGHLILAEEAAERLELNHILWVLTPFPPHKKMENISPLHDRMSMVLLAIAGNQKFSLSRVDIDRQPPHYAADTVAILREKSPEDEFYYLLGADSLNDLPSWHEPDQFVSICHGIVIMRRHAEPIDTTQLEAQIPGLSMKLHFLDTPIIEISGSNIRRRVQGRKQFRYFVPEKIFHYILNHKLYQD
jgi:nicotinate-nucleotide adenylyltransferase